MQTNYFTPIKGSQSYHRQLFNSDSVHREGDWVCVNCQNLNYSFRKKCNRCKTQSRQENDKHSVYSYYYYPRPDIFNSLHQKETQHYLPTQQQISHPQNNQSFGDNFDTLGLAENNHKDNQSSQSNAVMETPKKKKPLLSSNSKLDGLPSVSPLVKKYRQKQHHTTLEKLNQNTTEFESDQKDFDSIKIRDFDKLIQDLTYTNGAKNDLQTSPFKENLDEEDIQGLKFMKEIEESISRIII